MLYFLQKYLIVLISSEAEWDAKDLDSVERGDTLNLQRQQHCYWSSSIF